MRGIQPHEKVNAVTLRPHQLGWLLRSDLGKGTVQVWEKPNGDLYAYDCRRGPLLLQYMRMNPH